LLSQDLRATKIEVERVRKDYEKCKDDLEASMKQNIELIDRIRKHERDLDDLNNHCRKVENYREEVNRRNSELVSTLEKYESELHAWQQRCKHMETLYGDLQGKNQIPSNPFVGWRPVLYPSQPVTPLRLDDSNLLHQRHPSADDGVAELRRIWAYGRR
jgi:predicted nuclease with TOPRIM domain